MGNDLDDLIAFWDDAVFQSTFPVWGTTKPPGDLSRAEPNFNPRSPCGERPGAFRGTKADALYFNPRSPCGERRYQIVQLLNIKGFQSTFPVWGTTDKPKNERMLDYISIHVPRVGNDPYHFTGKERTAAFQSTFPVWGTTHRPAGKGARRSISIHVPRVGNDLKPFAPGVCRDPFQSTFPVWGTTPQPVG